jgi:hypothetical protein
MSKQKKKDRRQQILIELEALEIRILDCYSIIEKDNIEAKIKELNQQLKNLKD